jgi:hypothetical protein
MRVGCEEDQRVAYGWRRIKAGAPDTRRDRLDRRAKSSENSTANDATSYSAKKREGQA